MTASAAPAATLAGAGPAVVLLHGQPGTSADWAAVIPHLAERFTVLAVDRPGYGRTGGRAGGFAANGEAVLRLLDELGVERAVVVGHSWAGGVALWLAEQRPARLAGAVLVASVSPLEPPSRLDRVLACRPLGEAVATIGLAGGGRLLSTPRVWGRIEGRLTPPTLAALGALVSPANRRLVRRSFAVEQRAYVTEARELAPSLGAVTAPVALVHGAGDRVVPARSARRLADALPGATLRLVPGHGHLLPYESPEEIAGAVLEVDRRATPV